LDIYTLLDPDLQAEITSVKHEGKDHAFKLSRKTPADPSTTDLLIKYPPFVPGLKVAPNPLAPEGVKKEPNPKHQLCTDDDESAVSLGPIVKDNHVNLGYGRCLNKEDLERLPHNGMKWTDPVSRQPFTPLQNLAAKVLLMGGTVRYEQANAKGGKKRRLEASMLKLHV